MSHQVKIEQMERSLEFVISNLGEVVKNSRQPHKTLTTNGVNCSKDEVKQLMSAFADKTTALMREKLSEIVKSENLEEKYEKLERLIQNSEKINKELGVTDGYRPIDPLTDTTLHVRKTFETLKTPLQDAIEAMKEEIEEKTRERDEKKAVLRELVNLLEKQTKEESCN
ncbi:unnamed protein product [Caenorhabditis auriculariae]|uniref:Uncharacterized protein n=1 Tax=Caenorhabditis auriculariae TaxID=2777116 RepID=A0A8S1GZ52_9PELO|nr:unnamed protein product [Caenorhabditis auriculariae]